MLKGQITVWELLEGIEDEMSIEITVDSFENNMIVTDIVNVYYSGLILDCTALKFIKTPDNMISYFKVELYNDVKLIGSLVLYKEHKLIISHSCVGKKHLYISREDI